ncbi:MAG: hypothetical protein JXO22_12165, partial [Phycisphaerae bacterium]|nr:hypothetical protein [Phycisphaerae bacterium]
GDILVTDPTYDQAEPAMCKAPDGTLFIAVEQYGVDYDGWVRVYRSTDGGQSWAWLVSFITGDESRNPSIAYAERASGENWIYLAYEATMSDSTKRITVNRFDPDEPGETWDAVTAATGITGTSDIYPRVCTDDLIYDTYFVYVTYAVYAIDYYAAMFTRSTDYGLTYEMPQNITGGAQNSSFLTRPDIAYGSAGLVVAFEKLGWSGSAWKTQVWVTRSTNFGSTWNDPVQLTTAEDGAWHPSVAAAVGASTVMVAYTQSFASQTDIFCAYSTNGGDSYSPSSALPRTFDNEKSVALSVSDSGGRYHAAFWRAYDIMYTYTDATSPLPWAPATLVNEANWASSVYSRPAICVNPTKPLTQEACVAWSDYRGVHYDVYFDAGFLDGACCLPDESCIETNETECLETGGIWQGSGVECTWDLCLIDPCDEDVLAPIATLDLGDFQCVPFTDATPIVGIANDPEGNLQSWVLEERGMGAAPWTVVASGFTPIVGGVLTNWNPAAPGYRMLRLTVADACGHATTDVHLMYADQGPQATINFPTDGVVIGGSAVCIDALVSHGVCAVEWLLEYRPAAGSWTYLADGTGSVHNLPLTHWDTTSVADGLYEIRVTATSTGGAESHTVGVTVDNTAPTAVLTEPINCAWINGEVEIHGLVADDNMAHWDIQWTGGPANNWNTIDGGTESASGLLATWDVSDLPNCPYTLRLIAHDEARLNCTNDGHWTEYLVSVRVGVPEYDTGDLNCDGTADLFDIDAFILAILDPAEYYTNYPGCDVMLADCNGDGYADVFDIDAFVAIIVGG